MLFMPLACLLLKTLAFQYLHYFHLPDTGNPGLHHMHHISNIPLYLNCNNISYGFVKMTDIIYMLRLFQWTANFN